MMKRELLLFVFAGAVSMSLTSSAKAGSPSGVNDLDKIIQELQEKVAELQVKKGIPLDPPFQAYHQYGSYPSNIRVYFHGSPPVAMLRDIIAFPDSNSFVTMWVSEILLETARFSNRSVPLDDQLLPALQAVSEYHDKNQQVRNPILVFWPQSCSNKTGSCVCGPINLDAVVKVAETLNNYLEKLLDELGLSALADEIEKIVDPLIGITAAFYIPPDFDDTFLNLGFGSLLKSYSRKSNKSYEAWLSNNTNISVIMTALKKYAYRPFSSDNDSNSIDPRTFFYMRDFIYSAAESGRQLALIPTWVQNITETRANYYKKVRMPFNVNNVDLTVSANVIYGITAAILNDMQNPSDWFDKDLQDIYNDSVSLIAWEIERNFSSRPDLALTYYPSVYNFFWFTSRTLNLLASSQSLPFLVMEGALAMLKTTVREHATNIILKQAIVENGSNSTYAYFDDFLGDGDTNIFGKPVKHGEDRICSTAMAVNMLFYSWTENYQFVPDTPSDVQWIIIQASEWLVDYALSGKYKPKNAVFSGSVKSSVDLPFFYPRNVFEFINGSSVPKDYIISANDSNLIIGVSGVIPNATYQQLLEKKYLGQNVPIDFPGFNAPDSSAFPFWSSEPFTYAASLLALTQYKAFYNSLNHANICIVNSRVC